jgi:Mg2+/Co2+ transporter CorB
LATFVQEFLQYLPLFIALIILLIGSAFFSASETAYSTVNIIRLRNYLDEKRKGAKKAVYIAEKFDMMLATLLIGNNLVNIASTTIAAYFFSRVIINPTVSSILNTVIMTIIILVFGEVLPKSYGKANAEKFALYYSGVLYIISLKYYIHYHGCLINSNNGFSVRNPIKRCSLCDRR